MQIDGKAWRTIWPSPDGRAVSIIDQTRLPHVLEVVTLHTLADAARAVELD
jgi:methylthioribose-1-phosphate isomerase